MSDARAHQARQRAAESLQWHANYHDGMYDIHNAPTEFYGLLKTDHQAAEDVLYLADRVAALETALREIGHWPFDVNSDAHIDLREIKDFAVNALAGAGGEPETP